jgi:hypothetical protein
VPLHRALSAGQAVRDVAEIAGPADEGDVSVPGVEQVGDGEVAAQDVVDGD